MRRDSTIVRAGDNRVLHRLTPAEYLLAGFADVEPSSSHEPETIEYCVDVVTAEHLHAVDCRRRAFATFAIARAEDHRVLHRIAAAAAGFLVRTYHFIVSANCCCTVSLPAEEVELPPSQEPEYHRVLHRITAAAADHVL